MHHHLLALSVRNIHPQLYMTALPICLINRLCRLDLLTMSQRIRYLIGNSQFQWDPLQWHEWIDLFRTAIDSQRLTDTAKLTYLKTLVSGKAKSVITEFAYCGAMYHQALRALEAKFGQPQAVVGAHLDKLKNHPPFKMHNSDSIIQFSLVVSNLVAVFRSLNYEADLKCASVLSDALSKLPPNLKESWSMHTVKKHWLRPTLLDFNDWLKEKGRSTRPEESLRYKEQSR